MCNQVVPSVTLQTAVLMVVKEFAKNNQQFSIFDITNSIRHKTSQGELEIPEVEVQGASFRFDIPHVKVKQLFNELQDTGIFDPDFSLTRQFNGTFNVFTPSPINVSAPAPVVPAPSQVTPPVPAPANVAVTSATSLQSNLYLGGKEATSVVMNRVEKYLMNCKARNFRPTLKQIQSAIKRNDVSTGWSCEELKQLVVHDLGYAVVSIPDMVSICQVITV